MYVRSDDESTTVAMYWRHVKVTGAQFAGLGASSRCAAVQGGIWAVKMTSWSCREFNLSFFSAFGICNRLRSCPMSSDTKSFGWLPEPTGVINATQLICILSEVQLSIVVYTGSTAEHGFMYMTVR